MRGEGVIIPQSLQGMVLEGLTKFILKRARQEAIAFILETVGNKICRNADAQPLFPATCSLFSAADVTRTAVVPGRSFRRAVIDDLRSLPWNVSRTLRRAAATLDCAEPSCEDTRQMYAVLSRVLAAVDHVSCGLTRNQPPLAMITAVASRVLGKLDASLAAKANVWVIPKELRFLVSSITTMLYEASASEIKTWIENPRAFVKVVALRLRAVAIGYMEDLVFELKAKLAEATSQPGNPKPPELQILQRMVERFGKELPRFVQGRLDVGGLETFVAELDAEIETLKTATSEIGKAYKDLLIALRHGLAIVRDPSTLKANYGLLKAALDNAKGHIDKAHATAPSKLKAAIASLGTSVSGLGENEKLSKLIEDAEKFWRAKVQPFVPHAIHVYRSAKAYRKALGTGNEAERAALRRLLSAMVTTLEALVNHDPVKAGRPTAVAASQLLEAASLFLQRDYVGGVNALLRVKAVKRTKAYEIVGRFGTLFSDIGAATSGDEVAAALESAAAPLGSWRMRRKKTTWGLSARAGFGGGLEWFKRSSEREQAATLGLSIPVLIDAWKPRSDPIGIGVQILDLGTLATLSDHDDLEVEPNAGFLQVLSLGPSLSVGLGNSPFVLSMSLAWTPALRVEATDPETERSALRLTVNVAVDVPIFMF